MLLIVQNLAASWQSFWSQPHDISKLRLPAIGTFHYRLAQNIVKIHQKYTKHIPKIYQCISKIYQEYIQIHPRWIQNTKRPPAAGPSALTFHSLYLTVLHRDFVLIPCRISSVQNFSRAEFLPCRISSYHRMAGSPAGCPACPGGPQKSINRRNMELI